MLKFWRFYWYTFRRRNFPDDNSPAQRIIEIALKSIFLNILDFW